MAWTLSSKKSGKIQGSPWHVWSRLVATSYIQGSTFHTRILISTCPVGSDTEGILVLCHFLIPESSNILGLITLIPRKSFLPHFRWTFTLSPPHAVHREQCWGQEQCSASLTLHLFFTGISMYVAFWTFFSQRLEGRSMIIVVPFLQGVEMERCRN